MFGVFEKPHKYSRFIYTVTILRGLLSLPTYSLHFARFLTCARCILTFLSSDTSTSQMSSITLSRKEEVYYTASRRHPSEKRKSQIKFNVEFSQKNTFIFFA